jgi:hypothetical protein
MWDRVQTPLDQVPWHPSQIEQLGVDWVEATFFSNPATPPWNLVGANRTLELGHPPPPSSSNHEMDAATARGASGSAEAILGTLLHFSNDPVLVFGESLEADWFTMGFENQLLNSTYALVLQLIAPNTSEKAQAIADARREGAWAHDTTLSSWVQERFRSMHAEFIAEASGSSNRTDTNTNTYAGAGAGAGAGILHSSSL